MTPESESELRRLLGTMKGHLEPGFTVERAIGIMIESGILEESDRSDALRIAKQVLAPN